MQWAEKTSARLQKKSLANREHKESQFVWSIVNYGDWYEVKAIGKVQILSDKESYARILNFILIVMASR